MPGLLTTYKETWTRLANIYFRDPLDYLVFKNRNKNFGAYELRLLSNKVLFWSVLFSTITFCASIIGTSIYLHSKEEEYEEDLTVVEYIAFDSSIPKLNIPKGDKEANSKTKNAPKEESTPKEDKPKKTSSEPNKNTNPTISETPKDSDSNTTDKKDSSNASALKGDSSGIDEKGGYSVGSEEHAQPIGGIAEYAKYISQHFKYPEELIKDNIGGTVFVSILVDSSGKVSRIKVLRGLNKILDDRVLETVKAAPNWVPAKQAGRATFEPFVIPVKIPPPRK